MMANVFFYGCVLVVAWFMAINVIVGVIMLAGILIAERKGMMDLVPFQKYWIEDKMNRLMCMMYVGVTVFITMQCTWAYGWFIGFLGLLVSVMILALTIPKVAAIDANGV